MILHTYRNGHTNIPPVKTRIEAHDGMSEIIGAVWLTHPHGTICGDHAYPLLEEKLSIFAVLQAHECNQHLRTLCIVREGVHRNAHKTHRCVCYSLVCLGFASAPTAIESQRVPIHSSTWPPQNDSFPQRISAYDFARCPSVLLRKAPSRPGL